MPGVSKGLRAEAKYNVILDFPHLGLHSAAATGNIGLVKYALEHGQPINSVLDGVLPLHAACSGGDDLVVRLLIDKGADVNAPRLPRRYSNDKNRDASTPIVGTSGSTPLHFACANGHTSVVLTLLLHGAHPDRPDKHGVTPEMLARNNGWSDCADVLKQWSHNKDKDLREREGLSTADSFPESADPATKSHRQYCGQTDCRDCSTRKRLRVKRSIDNALNILKPSSHSSSPCPALTPLASTSTSGGDEPPSPTGHLGEYPHLAPTDAGSDEISARRPSHPPVGDAPRGSTSGRRPSGFSASTGSSSRRPRSAGTDAEQPSTPAKIKGKISLLNIFKKGTGETPESLSASSSAFHSTSPSPAPDSRTSSIPIAGGSYRSNRSTDALNSTPPDYSPFGVAQRIRNRLLSESSGNSPSRLPLELHGARSKESLVVVNDASSATDQQSYPTSTRSPPIRPILRAHGRSSSSQSAAMVPTSSQESTRVHSPGSSGRALRFDATATSTTTSANRPDRRRHESRSPSRGPRGSTSYTSLRSRSPGSPWGMSFRQESEGDISMPYTSPPAEYPERKSGNGNIEEEDEEEEYGQPVVPHVGLVHSSSGSSSSDIITPAQEEGQDVFDCPFSINRPLQDDEDTSTVGAAPSSRGNLLGIDGIDSRMRGDSLSSMSTNPSAYVVTPALSHMNLPAASIYSPPSFGAELPEDTDEAADEQGMVPFKRSEIRISHIDVDEGDSSQDEGEVVSPSPPSSTTTRSSRTSRPVDIDIRSISSHAQAEALVQHAQQRVFDFVNNPSEEDVNNGSSSPASTLLGAVSGEGRTPLSARLAAYGQSLKIEQKFKEEETKKRSPRIAKNSGASSRSGGVLEVVGEVKEDVKEREGTASARVPGTKGLDRTFSLDERHPTSGSRSGRVRRPHTAGGTPISANPDSLVPRERSPLRASSSTHQHSLSSAAALSSFEPSAKSSLRLGGSGNNTPMVATSITPPTYLLTPTTPLTKIESRTDSHSLAPSQSHTHPRSLSQSHTPIRHSSSLSPFDNMSHIQRSRTPDPTNYDTPSTRPVGVPLSRYSTAPNDGFEFEKTLSKQEREMARASKLTKMGFAAAGVGGAGVPAEGWTGRSGGGGQKHRFGGIKTLVQSLTGKS
ncbi:hypothetical protein BXZ70DRAFT_912873 [Cristinia sonorae]|uniref:Ankyrin n=1 Tax=Cristinia sonorae TaxID=1940300 RepID=A0A8K0UZR2_9AGAR|nr:hypothetical protein BXZ70DRAFT_912873 [Cristinia sonorae]